MSKLIISIGTLSSGGAERVLSVLATPFCDNFDEVIIVMWCKAAVFYKIDKRVKLICVEEEVGSMNDFKRMKYFRSFIQKEPPSLILSFLEPYNLRVLLSTIGIKCKKVVAERNDPRYINGSWLMGMIEKTIYSLADGILVQTETIREYFNGKLAKRTKVIYNPVSLDKQLVGIALNTEKKNRIVAAARLEKQKNLEMLIKAFSVFVKKHEDFTLTIYGEGPYRNVLETLIKDLSLEGKAFLPGATKELWSQISNARCFALSSWHEGMPNALIEAMALGLCCVSTKVSGACDLIKNNENGILVELNDHESMANAFGHIVDNQKLAENLSLNAVNIYEQLKEEVISKQWVDYLKMF